MRKSLAYLHNKVEGLWIDLLKKKTAFYRSVGETECISSCPEERGFSLHKSYLSEKIPLHTESGQTFFLYKNKTKKLQAQWMEETESGKIPETFYSWLKPKTKELSFQKLIKAHSVRYFDDNERAQTEVHVNKNGRLSQIGIDSKGSNHVEMEGKFLFIYVEYKNEKGKRIKKLFASPKIETDKGKIQHSSFCRGRRVTAAGVLHIDSTGKIQIYNESGHYRPTRESIEIVSDYFKDELGVAPQAIEKKPLLFKIYG